VQNLFHVELKSRNTRSASCTPTANVISRFSGTAHCNGRSVVIHDLLHVGIFTITTIREIFRCIIFTELSCELWS